MAKNTTESVNKTVVENTEPEKGEETMKVFILPDPDGEETVSGSVNGRKYEYKRTAPYDVPTPIALELLMTGKAKQV